MSPLDVLYWAFALAVGVVLLAFAGAIVAAAIMWVNETARENRR